MVTQDCIFCKIVHKEIPSDIILETEDIIVIQDIAPQAPIHFLIIPKMHVKDITSISGEQFNFLKPMFKAAQELSQQTSDGHFRLIINNGYNAGQRVFHLHMHFLSGTTMDE